MDGYPYEYVAHNLPLVILSGLGDDVSPELYQDWAASESGYLVESNTPSVKSDDANVLLKHFQESDARDAPWNGRENQGRSRFKVKVAGRVGQNLYQARSTD